MGHSNHMDTQEDKCSKDARWNDVCPRSKPCHSPTNVVWVTINQVLSMGHVPEEPGDGAVHWRSSPLREQQNIWHLNQEQRDSQRAEPLVLGQTEGA